MIHVWHLFHPELKAGTKRSRPAAPSSARCCAEPLIVGRRHAARQPGRRLRHRVLRRGLDNARSKSRSPRRLSAIKAPAAHHHPGRSTASSSPPCSAAARSANNAKQVAPLPLIRAIKAPGKPAQHRLFHRSRAPARSRPREIVAQRRQGLGEPRGITRHRCESHDIAKRAATRR